MIIYIASQIFGGIMTSGGFRQNIKEQSETASLLLLYVQCVSCVLAPSVNFTMLMLP
jgi:hypothetical protein